MVGIIVKHKEHKRHGIVLYNLNASNVKNLNKHEKNIHEENVDESLGTFPARNVMKDRI